MNLGSAGVARSSILIVSAFALSSMIACSGPDDREPTEARRYQVRGQVVRPVDTSAAERSLWLTHEAIPDFVGIDGELEGMDSMTMLFVLDTSLETSGLTKGTKVRFELTVDWSAAQAGKITAIEILPAETTLSFESSD